MFVNPLKNIWSRIKFSLDIGNKVLGLGAVGFFRHVFALEGHIRGLVICRRLAAALGIRLTDAFKMHSSLHGFTDEV